MRGLIRRSPTPSAPHGRVYSHVWDGLEEGDGDKGTEDDGASDRDDEASAERDRVAVEDIAFD